MSYYNSIQRLAHDVYDGFVLVVGSGGPFRTDLKTKLFRINTETEILLGLLQPQADSDVLRSWEIAGSSHVNYWAQMFRQGLVARDALAPFVFTCDQPPLSHVHNEYRNLKAGFILEEDAEQIITDAINSPVGTSVPLPIP